MRTTQVLLLALATCIFNVYCITVNGTTYPDLKTALLNVENGGTIYIDSETLTGADNIKLAVGNFTSLHFVGNSSSTSIIDCGINGPFFSLVASGAITLTFSNLGFTRCVSTSNGGGIVYVLATVVQFSFDNCDFRNNSASLQRGGAILIDNTAVPFTSTLTISNSNFFGNDGYTGGGAIAATNVYVRVNSTNFDSNSNSQNGADGGAVYLSGTRTSNGNSTFFNCQFTNNQVQGDGGAFATLGQIVATFDTVTFANNFANGNGGAIYNMGQSVLLANSDFTNNKANGDGGAIRNSFQSGFTGFNVRFVNNSATSGGATYNAGATTLNGNNLTFTGNVAISNGGACAFFDSGKPSLTRSTISGNTAANGGAIYITAAKTGATLSSITVSNNKASSNGGGIWCGNSKLQMNDVTFSGNTAPIDEQFHCDTGVSGTVCTVSGNTVYTDSCVAVEYETVVETGAIVGGVIAGVALLLCCFLIIFYYKDPKQRFRRFIWKEVKEDEGMPNATDENKEDAKKTENQTKVDITQDEPKKEESTPEPEPAKTESLSVEEKKDGENNV